MQILFFFIICLGLIGCGSRKDETTPPANAVSAAVHVTENPNNSAEKFSMSEIHGKRIAVDEVSTAGRPQKVKVRLEACLESASAVPSFPQNVTIETESETLQKPVDSRTGCFTWDESVAFDYFTKERFISRIVKLSSGTYSGEFTLMLDPWQYMNASAAVLDPRFEDPMNGPSSTVSSELVMTGAVANFAGRSFQLDSLLNLTIIRKFRFEMRPMIKRMTQHGWQDESLGNGKYRLFILIESPSGKVLTAFEKPVESEAGSINTEIELEFDDIRNTFQRNHIFMELQPVRPVPGLARYAYEGMFEALSDGGWIRTLNAKRSIIQDVRRFKRSPRILAEDTAAMFAKAYNLYTPSTEEARHYDLGSSQFGALVHDPRNPFLLRKFCAWFFANRADVNRCIAAPETYIGYQRSEHMEKLLSEPVHTISDPMTFGVSSGFSVSKGQSQDETEGQNYKKAELSIAAKGKFFDVIDIGLATGYTWYKTWSKTKRNAQDQKVDGSLDKRLEVEEIHFDLNAEVKQCITLFPIQGGGRLKDMFVCDEKPLRRAFTEKYYYMYQYVQPGLVLDRAGPISERRWLVLIRGEQRFKNFVQMMTDRIHVVNLTQGSPIPANILNGSLERYDGYFPGLLTQGR